MAKHTTVGGYPNPDPHYVSPEEEDALSERPVLLYTRDDGTEVAIEQCTREELLVAIRQLRSRLSLQAAHIKGLQKAHSLVRDQAYRHAAVVVAALATPLSDNATQ
jgi:hypothetical protein